MNQSQENCLTKNHRYTHERWVGDYAFCAILIPAGGRDFLFVGTETLFFEWSAVLFGRKNAKGAARLRKGIVQSEIVMSMCILRIPE